MNYRCRRRTFKSEINIVPFLDVLLVLLLILMATTPMIHQSVQVDLPNARAVKKGAEDLANKAQVILEIAGIGQYTLIINNRRLEQLPGQQVLRRVKTQLSQNTQTCFFIGGAATVPYEEIIKGLSLLQQAGVSAVGLITKPLAE